jgi:hypothetical protein
MGTGGKIAAAFAELMQGMRLSPGAAVQSGDWGAKAFDATNFKRALAEQNEMFGGYAQQVRGGAGRLHTHLLQTLLHWGPRSSYPHPQAPLSRPSPCPLPGLHGVPSTALFNGSLFCLQDCMEFLCALLDFLHEDLNRVPTLANAFKKPYIERKVSVVCCCADGSLSLSRSLSLSLSRLQSPAPLAQSSLLSVDSSASLSASAPPRPVPRPAT